MTDDEMNAIRARLDAACPGPWTGMTIHRWLDGNCLTIVHQNENGRTTIAATLLPAYSDPDTALLLLLHAREDIEALIAEVERLRDNADARERFHRREHDLLRAAERERDTLRAENGKLRDVLEWSEAQCPGKCAGVCGDALTYAAERGEHNQGEKE